jgi:hypothetical protein
VIRTGVAGAVALAAALAPAPSRAQETRTDEIARAQAEKAAQIQPYEASRAEQVLARMKERFLRPDRFFVVFDSVYGGGGLTLGGGYRRFYGDRTFWTARGLLSVKGYKLVEVATDTPGHGRKPVSLNAVGGWRDATQVSFYGVGQDTSPDARTNFRLQQAYAGASASARGPGALVVDFGARVEDYTLEEGTSGSSPSIEEVFTAETAPGLGANPTYVHTTLGAAVDWRPATGYARRGGRYGLAWDAFVDTDGVYSFERLQAEVVQHIPVLRETWVLSLHGVARTTLDDDATVPYFLLPALGSGSTLRAYPSWRFRDRHSLLLSGEWRWIPNRMFLDMAFFYDAGKVTARREDLNFSGLTQDAGVGFRLHGPQNTPLRIDVARGREGVNIVFSGSAAF